MSKVFRINNIQGDNNISGWGEIAGQYDSQIAQISDPQGGNDKQEITSIPSPFARIDLVKTAFREVHGNLDGQTIYHKMVSDCFDIGEIFFNSEKLKSKIKIIPWNPQAGIQEMMDSYNPKQILLADTLAMFLKQDADSYNFKYLADPGNQINNSLYILVYTGSCAKSEMDVIGATSPATIFFSNANDLSYMSSDISFGQDHPFDNKYCPLYKRSDFEYVKWWYSFRNYINKNVQKPSYLQGKTFSALFPELNDYLNDTYQKLTPQQRGEISNLTDSSLVNDYEELRITGSDLVELFGISLMKKSSSNSAVLGSDFIIDSTKYAATGNQMPLVLPVDKGNSYSNLKYVTSRWDSSVAVPTSDKLPLSERTLPGDDSKYPYLTIGDFLEDTIIINKYKKAKGYYPLKNDSSNFEWSYLLPLKKLFFDFFDIKDIDKYLTITRLVTNGQNRLNVELKIPVQNGRYVVYSKKYSGSVSDDFHNPSDGYVTEENRFTLAIYPFVKPSIKVPSKTRVSILSLDEELDVDSTRCYSVESTPIGGTYLSELDQITPAPVRRNKDDNGNQIDDLTIVNTTTFVYEDSKPLSFAEVNMTINRQKVRGLVVPQYNGSTNNQDYTFAIDFGTSNTHIEWFVESDKNAKPFSISEGLDLVGLFNENLATDAEEIYRTVLSDMMPSKLGGLSDYKFPIRTVLSERKGTDWKQPIYPMAQTNIPFTYEKLPFFKYNEPMTNLKWSTDSSAKPRIKNYLENILYLIRNKVLVEGGNLQNTKIVWFYPASMSENMVNTLKTLWVEVYKKYISTNNVGDKVIYMSESIAPYYFYDTDEGVSPNKISVDIGGGTTDIIIAQNNTPAVLTSFRFAANSLFSNKVKRNVFIKKFGPEIKSVLDSNRLNRLSLVYTEISNRDRGEDVMNFFFSLIDNKELRDKKLVVDINKMMCENSEIKILFLIFYASIIYHIAKIVKVKNFKEPRAITFSGTGSKILKILVDLESSKKTLEKFTMLIFEKVLGRNYDSNGLTIYTDPDHPKEATCKGGLKNRSNQDADDLENIRTVLLTTNTVVNKDNRVIFKDVLNSDRYKEQTIKDVKEFTKMLYTLNAEFSFKNKFGALSTDSLQKLNGQFNRDLDEFIDRYIMEEKQMLINNGEGESESIRETLFFYAIKGIINAVGEYLISGE